MKKPTGFVFVGLLLLTTTIGADGERRHEDAESLLPSYPAPLRRAECGGTIRADESSLSFPGTPGESLIGGETCVWIINLESTRDFRFNFTQFDVNSDESSCSSAGVRLYSLSNLVPPGELQNELFCSGRPPSDSGFYLGGSVAALVVYSTPNNSAGGSGFTLSWKGASFDPLITTHVSSFSTVESGVVSYPVAGNYEPNLVATWAVATEQGRRSDVVIESVDVESCPNSDPCTCDALILYEVEERGVLSENGRFCANSSVPVERRSVADRFLLAFFTDFNESSGGSGFSAKYFPTATGTTTSTPPTTETITAAPTNATNRPTTSIPTAPTEEPTTPAPSTTPCGGVFSEPSGFISFHLDDKYSNYERCVWTLQNPRATGYKFNITDYLIVNFDDDVLIISTLLSYRSAGNELNTTLINHRPREEVFTLTGDVAILTFYSDDGGTSKGFRIEYEAILRPDFESDPRTGVIVQETSSLIVYPSSGYYRNLELSTFIFSPNSKFDPIGNFTNVVEYYQKGLETHERCYDRLNVYRFVPVRYTEMEWAPYPDNFLLCSDKTRANYTHDDMLLFVFKTDYTNFDLGFTLDFYRRPNNDEAAKIFS